MVVKLAVTGAKNGTAIRERRPCQPGARRDTKTGRQALVLNSRAIIESKLGVQRPMILREGRYFPIRAVERIAFAEVNSFQQPARRIDDVDRPESELSGIAGVSE